MGKRIDSRLQALEASRQAMRAKGRLCFEQSTSEPALYHGGTMSMGLSAETFTRAEISALSAQGWQCTLLEWVSAGQGEPEPGEQRVQLAWE